jgi:hypothetical protein
VRNPSPRRLAAIATAAILAAAALAAARAGDQRHAPPTQLLGRPIRAGTPPATASSPSAAPVTVLEASEAFAASYVAFLRGREPAAAVPYASGSLRARLAQLHPQLPAAAIAWSNPRLTSVRVDTTRRATAISTAVIEDGEAIDPLTMRLARRAHGWIVIDLAETG